MNFRSFHSDLLTRIVSIDVRPLERRFIHTRRGSVCRSPSAADRDTRNFHGNNTATSSGRRDAPRGEERTAETAAGYDSAVDGSTLRKLSRGKSARAPRRIRIIPIVPRHLRVDSIKDSRCSSRFPSIGHLGFRRSFAKRISTLISILNGQ